MLVTTTGRVASLETRFISDPETMDTEPVGALGVSAGKAGTAAKPKDAPIATINTIANFFNYEPRFVPTQLGQFSFRCHEKA